MITRRDLLKAAGAAAAGAAGRADADPREVAPGPNDAAAEPRALSSGTTPLEQTAPRTTLQALTADEADLLTAIVARLIPADASGPGAVEAGAVAYIDRALAGALSSSREAYRRGLAALERYAQSSRGTPFRQLSPTDQDALLIDVETGAATAPGAGLDSSSTAFFALVRAHTWQGTFGDPFYGGNRNFVGWDLLGYPGVRTAVAADDQRLGTVPAPVRRSAYESDMFNKG
ncbi:MAG: gluconate 2-dehydrogenase subunit 3 family protein [Acidobacteriota bacterium]|nr:gluconate 2-dehydrogenase subunit 3 family protein [Acidobacteriota bacterium]